MHCVCRAIVSYHAPVVLMSSCPTQEPCGSSHHACCTAACMLARTHVWTYNAAICAVKTLSRPAASAVWPHCRLPTVARGASGAHHGCAARCSTHAAAMPRTAAHPSLTHTQTPPPPAGGPPPPPHHSTFLLIRCSHISPIPERYYHIHAGQLLTPSRHTASTRLTSRRAPPGKAQP